MLTSSWSHSPETRASIAATSEPTPLDPRSGSAALPLAAGHARRPAMLRSAWRRRMIRASVRFRNGTGEAIRRGFDIAVALIVGLLGLLVALPCWLGLLRSGEAIVGLPRYGRGGQRFVEYRFRAVPGRWGRYLRALGLDRWPMLWNLLKGDLTLVGPRAVAPDDRLLTERLAARRFSDRPGLVCLWWVRRRANIAYESELESDLEYVESRGWWSNWGIAFRAAVSACWGLSTRTEADRINVLGVSVANRTMRQALDSIETWSGRKEPRQVCFVNADCANWAARHATYRACVNQADMTLADGIGLKLAGRLLGTHFIENVNGTDLFPRLCAQLQRTQRSLFLLGARPGVAQAVADWIDVHFPGVRIAGVRHGYFEPEVADEVVRTIRASRADIVLVALGAPRQDLWIREHLHEMGCSVAIGVGGLFDYYSGRVRRAPRWVRELCLEWLFRFSQEPSRLWRRYWIGNGVFLVRVLAQRFLGWYQHDSRQDSCELDVRGKVKP